MWLMEYRRAPFCPLAMRQHEAQMAVLCCGFPSHQLPMFKLAVALG
jgi:hypothetical protein